MKLNFLSLSFFFFLGLISFTSCDKENLDNSITEEEETTTEVVTCNLAVSIQEDSGTLTASASGGTEPYIFLWSDGSIATGGTESTISVTNGNYTVEVTDAQGCIIVESFTVTGSDPCNSLAVDLSTDNGILTATPSGGNPGYAYTWSTGEVTASISYTAGNSYTATIVDTEGCTVTKTIQL